MLGELLATRGKLDSEVLFRALRHQRAHGGRLSTCLLELEAVSEDDLLHVLSEQLRHPFVAPEELRSVGEEVIRLVPQKLARQHQVVPFRASGTQLALAMLDPHDLAALDELAFASARRLRPHVATEVRLHEALGKYYHAEVSSRFVKLLDRLNRALYLWGEGETPAAESGVEAEAPSAPRSTHPREPLPPLHPREPVVPPQREPTLAAAVAAPPSEQPPPAASPAPLLPPPLAEPPTASAADEPLSFALAEEQLLEPAERDDVARTLVAYARSRGYDALTLMIRRDAATGWLGAGEGLDNEAVRALRMPLAEPSLVLALRDGAALHRGPLSPLRGNRPLAALLGERAAGDLLALPLRVRRRVVATLVVASTRSTFPAELADELTRLAAKASVALEMLVLKQKLQHA